MTLMQAAFWLESIAYDLELTNEAAEAGQPKQVHNLDELVKILPKGGKSQ